MWRLHTWSKAEAWCGLSLDIPHCEWPQISTWRSWNIHDGSINSPNYTTTTSSQFSSQTLEFHHQIGQRRLWHVNGFLNSNTSQLWKSTATKRVCQGLVQADSLLPTCGICLHCRGQQCLCQRSSSHLLHNFGFICWWYLFDHFG